MAAATATKTYTGVIPKHRVLVVGRPSDYSAYIYIGVGMTLLAIDALTDWTAQVLGDCGVPAGQAVQAARLLVRSDARGYGTHGLTRLPSYVERLRAGDFNPRPRLQHRELPGGIVLDADNAMGHVA